MTETLLDPGCLDCCEDCKSQQMFADECGVSYGCYDWEACSDFNDAEREAWVDAEADDADRRNQMVADWL